MEPSRDRRRLPDRRVRPTTLWSALRLQAGERACERSLLAVAVIFLTNR